MKSSYLGKSVCRQLKAVRQLIAEENDIPLEQRECTYDGPCRGTCPRCEAEVQYLERSLAEKLRLGKVATVAGLGLSLTACGHGGPQVSAKILDEGEVDTTEVYEVDADSNEIPFQSVDDPVPPEVTTEGVVEYTTGEVGLPIECPVPTDGSEDRFYLNYFTDPPVKAEFPGGKQGLRRWLARHMQYPAEAREKGIVGEVVVALQIEAQGYISGYRIIKGLEGGGTEEAKRLVQTMPDWKPAGVPGKGAVPSIVMLTIPFIELPVAEGDVEVVDVIVEEGGIEDQIFTVVEDEPSFPGGMETLYKWIDSHLQYPEQAREEGIEGRVYVTFVVETDGTLSNARVLRDIGGGCGQAAIRMVYAMPKWEPGRQRGVPVRVQFNLPVKFKLE
ncbi:MAG: TonB family protein [Bacteroidales bacterium]|nr:TonB family protein [Bacteroidales bacterium]